MVLLPEPVSFYIVIERSYIEQRELETGVKTLTIEME